MQVESGPDPCKRHRPTAAKAATPCQIIRICNDGGRILAVCPPLFTLTCTNGLQPPPPAPAYIWRQLPVTRIKRVSRRAPPCAPQPPRRPITRTRPPPAGTGHRGAVDGASDGAHHGAMSGM